MEDVTIPRYTVIQYVRCRKNIPHGVLVAIKAEDGFRVGYSLCNRRDRFNKRMALKIALGRAENNAVVGEPAPHPVRKMIPAFLDRCTRYYKVSQ